MKSTLFHVSLSFNPEWVLSQNWALPASQRKVFKINAPSQERAETLARRKAADIWTVPAPSIRVDKIRAALPLWDVSVSYMPKTLYGRRLSFVEQRQLRDRGNSTIEAPNPRAASLEAKKRWSAVWNVPVSELQIESLTPVRF